MVLEVADTVGLQEHPTKTWSPSLFTHAFMRQDLTLQPGWPQDHGNPPATASLELRSQEWVTTPDYGVFYVSVLSCFLP